MRALRRFAIASMILSAALLGCDPEDPSFPDARDDDAGSASYARQIVPVLFARKARGYDEVKLLSDLIDATDRPTVVRALMEQPEFVDYWQEVLVDDLNVHREGIKQNDSCYGDPLLPGGGNPALADFVLSHTASAQFASPFNMSDLVRSSILKDNLYPAYRGHLFALANKPNFFLDVERLIRADLAGDFEHVFLNRQLGCLQCHNSQSSLSGEGSGWDRTHPIAGHFEAALYGSSTGTSTDQASAIFRTDARGGPLKPFGLTNCGTFKTTVPTDPEAVSAWFAAPLGRQASVRNLSEIFQFGYQKLKANGLDRSLPVTLQDQCDFCSTSCMGVSVAPDAPATAVNAAAVKDILANNCLGSGCHSGGAGSLTIPTGDTWYENLVSVPATQDGEIRVIPGDSSNSYLVKKLLGTGAGSQMPFGADPLLDPQIDTIKNWIDDIPSGAACNVCDSLECNPEFPPRVDGSEAAAFLLAHQIVNNVWQHVMGYPLTIANYFPRNSEQQAVLWNLTEYKFVPSDWSLKDLLVEIVTRDLFNRRAPAFSTGTTPYELPKVFDPWSEADPREPPVSDPGYDPSAFPEDHKNAMSDGLYRYSAYNLLHSVHAALGWPAPERLFEPFAPGYPDAALQKALGQFFSETSAESRNVDFQAMLIWESIHGVCERPSGVASDWIDALMSGMAAFSGPGGPLTTEDMVVTMRDWLLADGTIGTDNPTGLSEDEQAALAAVLGTPLSTPASAVTDLEPKLRQVCGAMLQSPDFWLAGAVPTGLGPEPRLRVCTAGPCSYQELCESLKPAIEAQLPASMPAHELTCGSDSISIAPALSARILVPADAELCPRALCGRIPLPAEAVERCLASPKSCSRIPPRCDPRRGGVDGCGGPLPRPERRGMLVAFVEGGEIARAENVRLLRAGDSSWTRLGTQDVLRAGDLLAVESQSKLAIRKGRQTLETPKGEFLRADPIGARLILVSSERLVTPSEPRPPRKPGRFGPDVLLPAYREGPGRFGEAGVPLKPEEVRGFVGVEEKLTPPNPRRNPARAR